MRQGPPELQASALLPDEFQEGWSEMRVITYPRCGAEHSLKNKKP
jgi:hypothetical protein